MDAKDTIDALKTRGLGLAMVSAMASDIDKRDLTNTYDCS
jgi:hypothetical protein